MDGSQRTVVQGVRGMLNISLPGTIMTQD